MPLLELLIAFFLILLNGIFALSELSIVSARRMRLKAMADAGRPGAASALALAEDPGRFLSTVQIGITLVGILAGAFSGAALGARLEEILLDQGLRPWLAQPLGYGIVITVITYLSVVIGELVPKQLALRHAEAIACRMAGPMRFLSRLGGPFIWLLDSSSRLVFRLLGQNATPETAVTEEEIKSIVAEAEAAGVIELDERQMIAGVLRLSDRNARGLMTPRMEVDWIDLAEDDSAALAVLRESPHSRLPVTDGASDDMLGVIQSRELLAAMLKGEKPDIRSHIRPAPFVPDTMPALDVLQVLRDAQVPMALVLDEYGNFEGVITPADILEAIAGLFHADAVSGQPRAIERADGSWLLAGSLPADELGELLHITLPVRRDYQTLAGLIIDELGRMPATGDVADVRGWRFEVVDMDGQRIDQVLARRAD